MNPEVSIIMPVYNKESYLQRVLEQILAQNFQKWELIAVDDGSSDHGREILERYQKKESRMMVWHQSNAGVSVARNQGLHLAKGRWIWFVDADDLPSGNFLTEVVPQMNDETVDVIAAGYTKVYPDGQEEIVQTEECGVISGRRLPRLFMEYQYRNGFWGYLWNKLIRHSLITEEKIQFQEHLTLAEDLKFMVQVYQHCKKLFLSDENAMYYTVNAKNSSAEKKIDYPAQLRIQREIYEWVVQRKKEQQYRDFFRRQLGNYLAFCVFYGFEEQEDPKETVAEIPDAEKILAMADINGTDKIMRPILYCLKKKRWHFLYGYLYGRKGLRSLYRSLWKRDEAKMRFVLYNHVGSKNHGCEALVRTVSEMFGRERTCLLSDAPEEEEKYQITDLIQVKSSISTKRASVPEWGGAYLKLKLQKNYFYMDVLPYKAAIRSLDAKDVLVSIGGDIFCYDDYPKYNLLHQYAKRKGKVSILIGCSIEPENLRDPSLVRNLKSFDVILARESLTCEALKKAGVWGVKLCPDSAFCLAAKETTLPDGFLPGNTVGINISPLVLRKSGHPDLIMENLRLLIRHLLEHTNASVALIPHVVWESNDDRVPLGNLQMEFADSKRVCMVEDQSAEKLKWLIGKCSYFIGARTHAVIAAYASGVPALAIGYSVKAKGIARDLFGTQEHYVLPYQDIKAEDTILKSFEWLMKNAAQTREILLEKTKQYQQQILKTGGELQRKYGEKQQKTKRADQHHYPVL